MPGDERGHIQASSLGGSNKRDNIVPQARDLNHGAYYAVEKGERDALKGGNSIYSEKIAYTNEPEGSRPNTFIVNDTISYTDGSQQNIHFSFANMSDAQQEGINQELDEHADMLDVQNPNDALRESMSTEEYADLMEKTDAELPGIADAYDEHISFTPAMESESEVINGIDDCGEGTVIGGIDEGGDLAVEGGISYDDDGEGISL